MDRYQDAIALLSPITPDTPHFKAVRQLMATYQMENSVLEALADAQEMAKRGKLGQAIQVLKPIPKKSKRFGQAQKLIADYQRRLTIARRPKAVNKPINSSGSETGTDAQLKALDAQKKALNAQMKAVEAQQAALKGTK